MTEYPNLRDLKEDKHLNSRAGNSHSVVELLLSLEEKQVLLQQAETLGDSGGISSES